MIFEWAILNNLRDDNPCKGAKIPQRVQTVDDIENSLITEKFLEKNEIQEFLAEVRKRGLYGDSEAFYLLIYSGLRPGELCALKWSDLNFSTGMLRISKTLYSPESNMYKIEITPPKTNAAIRNFDLDDVIIKMLKAYKADQEERQKRYKQVNDDFYDEKYMFSRPNGRPLIVWIDY
ncbi:site-specific integrase [Paenibacillus sp. P3E]|uniref:site-specific integrase n=1 Tax=Paenibacillus sp. P3E TaxID=1349435 RepID=UPI0035323E00